MSDTSFSIGDLVRHRASGERGVVVKLRRSCYAEGHRTGDMQNAIQHWLGFRDDCEVRVDSYDVTYGFDRTANVKPFEIEPTDSAFISKEQKFTAV